MVGPFWLFPSELVQIQGVCCWPPQVKSSLDGLDHGCYWLSIQLEPKKPSKCRIHLELYGFADDLMDHLFQPEQLRNGIAFGNVQFRSWTMWHVFPSRFWLRGHQLHPQEHHFQEKASMHIFWWVDSVYLLIYLGVSKNRGGPPKWMVYNGKPY